MEILLFGDQDRDDWISFHKSRLTLDCLNWASDRTKEEISKLEDKFDWINK